jgi:hypothetical protein
MGHVTEFTVRSEIFHETKEILWLFFNSTTTTCVLRCVRLHLTLSLYLIVVSNKAQQGILVCVVMYCVLPWEK